MGDSAKLMLVGMVSGLFLPEEVKELFLGRARLFRNPAAFREPGSAREIRANTAIYSGEGQQRHFVGDVATYLIELEIEAAGGQFGHTVIRGSGGVLTGISPESQGITSLKIGAKSRSAVGIRVPRGKTWDVPSLIVDQFQRAVLSLRLLTKGRILVFPVGVLASDYRQGVLESGLDKRCPELLGASLAVQLTAGDCKTIEDFSKKLAKANLTDFEVPISLFSRSFYKVDESDRALDLIIALESLLSGSPESIGYKLAFRASCLTAKEEDRWDTFRFIKKTYKYRSNLVHGKRQTLAKARTELGQRMERIEDLARKCLTLACLLEMGQVKLSSGAKANMRKEDQIDEYILTHCVTKKDATPLDSFPEIGKVSKGVRVL